MMRWLEARARADLCDHGSCDTAVARLDGMARYSFSAIAAMNPSEGRRTAPRHPEDCGVEGLTRLGLRPTRRALMPSAADERLPGGVIVIGPCASLRAHDRAHSHARMSAQGCARSNDPDLPKLRLGPTRRAESHVHPRHPESRGVTSALQRKISPTGQTRAA